MAGGAGADGRWCPRLLADDHALVRRDARLILDAEPDLAIVAEAGDGAEVVALARTEHPTSSSSTSPCLE